MFKFQLLDTPFISKRIRGTCICSSKSYVAIGVSTGTVYVLNNETFARVHVLTVLKDQPTHLSISPDESLIAIVTVSSLVIVNLASKQVTSVAKNLATNPVTALAWGLIQFIP